MQWWGGVMKWFRIWVLSALLAAGSQVAVAESLSLNRFTPKVLPVLVRVDAQGKVTDVSPSIQLAPRFDRLLRQSIREMIRQPAERHGRPVASQFVMQLAMRTTPRDDGKYDARFVYVSSSPVPPGQWFWQTEDGHRLVLVSRDGLQRRSPFYYDRSAPERRSRPFVRGVGQPAQNAARPRPRTAIPGH